VYNRKTRLSPDGYKRGKQRAPASANANKTTKGMNERQRAHERQTSAQYEGEGELERLHRPVQTNRTGRHPPHVVRVTHDGAESAGERRRQTTMSPSSHAPAPTHLTNKGGCCMNEGRRSRTRAVERAAATATAAAAAARYTYKGGRCTNEGSHCTNESRRVHQRTRAGQTRTSKNASQQERAATTSRETASGDE
jgi:hypothetical protein